MNNSIVWNNTAPAFPNWYNATFHYSCTTPLPSGIGNYSNISNAPQFVDEAVSNFHCNYSGRFLTGFGQGGSRTTAADATWLRSVEGGNEWVAAEQAGQGIHRADGILAGR